MKRSKSCRRGLGDYRCRISLRCFGGEDRRAGQMATIAGKVKSLSPIASVEIAGNWGQRRYAAPLRRFCSVRRPTFSSGPIPSRSALARVSPLP